MESPGIGVDIEEVGRFANAPQRLFTARELAHADQRLDSLAGIWCAKEAVVKAVSRWQQLSVRQVEITYDGDRPCATVQGFTVEVSISHAGEYAVAFAIAFPQT